jgi:acid phosphatase type 7
MRDAALVALLLLGGSLLPGCADPKPGPAGVALAGSGGDAAGGGSVGGAQAGAATSEVPLFVPPTGGAPPVGPEPSAGAAPDALGGGGAANVAGIRVAVISDLNDSYGSVSYSAAVHSAVGALLALEPDLVLSTGDMVAGQMAGLDYDGMWAGFHAAVTDELETAGLPLAVTPGNHDASGYAGFEKEREIFVRTWQERKPALAYIDDSSYPLRYSFSAGPALFVSLDDSTIGALDPEQMEWLEAQLTAGEHLPTKIVYGHVPLMPFSEGRETEIIGDAKLEDLLQRHGVTLFITGHHHAYYPGRRAGVRYVSTACLGAGPRPLIGTEAVSALSLLVFDLDATGAVTRLDAFGGKSFDTLVPRTSLPASIESGPWRVARDDL